VNTRRKTAASKPAPKSERKRATINDIARLANVSKKTVSRVINDSPFVKEDTREKINAIIAELGFEPDPQARALAFRRSFLIGMIYDNPTAQYVVNMQQGMLAAMRNTSFGLLVHPCDRASPTFLQDMRQFVERQKPSGVVLTPSVSEDDKLVQILQEIDCPYVRIASMSLDGPASMVVTHDSVGAGEAAGHLAELGHTRIAHISGPPTFLSAHERRQGFNRGLSKFGLKLKPPYDREALYTFDSGISAARELLAMKARPTAIFAGNDEMAAGVYKAAHDIGLEIPHDLSVIGYDDSPIATRLWPVLTTVRLPIRDMGQMAVEKLFRRYAAKSGEEEQMSEVTPSLIVRESTAPPPAL
jgi:LacI family transcriptional regulator, galactose operon repressor